MENIRCLDFRVSAVNAGDLSEFRIVLNELCVRQIIFLVVAGQPRRRIYAAVFHDNRSHGKKIGVLDERVKCNP